MKEEFPYINEIGNHFRSRWEYLVNDDFFDEFEDEDWDDDDDWEDEDDWNEDDEDVEEWDFEDEDWGDDDDDDWDLEDENED